MDAKDALRVIMCDPSGSGGICHYTFQLADNLAKLGNDVTVASVEGYELEQLSRTFKLRIIAKQSWIKKCYAFLKAQVCQLDQKVSSSQAIGLTQPPSAPRLSKLLARVLLNARLLVLDLKGVIIFLALRPNVVHFQSVNPDTDYSFLRLVKFLGFKIVYTVHDVLPHDTESFDDRQTFRKIYQAVDRIIVHSMRDREELIRAFGIQPGVISVVPHGSNALFYKGKDVTKQAARSEIGIASDKKVVLFFGLIQRYKGLEYLVEAFKLVQEKCSDTILLIAGKIHNRNRDDFVYYSNLLAGFADRRDVVCITQYIPHEKLSHYFLASDVVVLPYVKTYTSGVLATAYAAGRPVIVSDTGGLSEMVESRKSGFIVPPRDVKALAQAIIEIISSPKQLEDMGRYAKHLAETRYSWKYVASKTVDVYRSAV